MKIQALIQEIFPSKNFVSFYSPPSKKFLSLKTKGQFLLIYLSQKSQIFKMKISYCTGLNKQISFFLFFTLFCFFLNCFLCFMLLTKLSQEKLGACATLTFLLATQASSYLTHPPPFPNTVSQVTFAALPLTIQHLSDLVTSYQLLVTSYQLLAASHQLLVTSHLSLVTSYYLLVIKYQLLVTSYRSLVTCSSLLGTSDQFLITSYYQKPLVVVVIYRAIWRIFQSKLEK